MCASAGLSARSDGSAGAIREVGAATCFYVPTEVKTFAGPAANGRDDVGFLPGHSGGLATGRRQVRSGSHHRHYAEHGSPDSAAMRRSKIARRTILLVGRPDRRTGLRSRAAALCVSTVADYGSIGDLLHKRMRWIVVMRNMRPWGHFGLIFTQGLPWRLLGWRCIRRCGGCRIPGYVCGAACGDDRDDRGMGSAASGVLEEPLDDSAVGCCGLLDLAGELFAQQHSLAWG